MDVCGAPEEDFTGEKCRLSEILTIVSSRRVSKDPDTSASKITKYDVTHLE
jgi:hypothetical protein